MAYRMRPPCRQIVGSVRRTRRAGKSHPARRRRSPSVASLDGPPDVIAFGHSHQPMVERRDGIWLLNPGSPTDRRRQPTFSFLRVEVAGTALRPELVTFR
jgi:uncharacterized protein